MLAAPENSNCADLSDYYKTACNYDLSIDNDPDVIIFFLKNKNIYIFFLIIIIKRVM